MVLQGKNAFLPYISYCLNNPVEAKKISKNFNILSFSIWIILKENFNYYHFYVINLRTNHLKVIIVCINIFYALNIFILLRKIVFRVLRF